MNWLRKSLTHLYLRRYRVPRDMVRDAFERYAERPALLTSRGQLSFEELGKRVYSLSQALEAHGLQPGDRIFTLLPDDWEQVEARLAAFESNFVITSFHGSHRQAMIERAARIAEPKALIYDSALDPDLRTSLESLLPDLFVLSIGSGGSYEAAIAGAAPRRSRHPVNPEDPAGLGFTSGTTGEPKALFTSHGVIVTSLKLTATNVAVQRGEHDRFLLGIPLVGAGSGVVMPMLFSGALQIIPPAYTADHLVNLIQEHQVTRTFITPSLLIDLLDHPHANLSSLRNVIYGTAPMPVPKIEEAVRRWGPIFQQGYGMAEVLPPVCLLQMHQHGSQQKPAPRRILRSVGQIVPEVEVRIVNEDQEDLPRGEIGEVWIKSPTRFSGYWRNPEANQRALQGDWYRSGDLGHLSEDNFLTVLGRKADVIEGSDELIFPLLLEEVAHDHPGVKEAALVQDDTNHLHLVGSTRRDWATTSRARQLETELRQIFANPPDNLPTPDHIQIIDELPRSYLVKVLRRQVQQALNSFTDHSERIE